MNKKLLCLALVALLCLPALFSCAKSDGTPAGMKSVTVDGDPFILYVPNEWSDNRDSGLSSAHYGLNVITTARYYAIEGDDISLDSFVNAHIAELEKKYSELSFTRKDAKLGKEAPAVRLEYDFEHEGSDKNGKKVTSTAKSISYFALNGTNVVMLSFYCQSSSFEQYADAFEQIRSVFVLRPMPELPAAVTDNKTPEGMKIASGDVEYRFYVPNSWVADLSDNLSFAYYPESGRPNVSVTSYSPDGSMSAETYFEASEEEYKKTIQGYEFIEKAERTVDGIKAISYTYKAVYGSTELRIMQTIFVRSDLVYSITYTARADSFDEHLDDLNKMLDSFRFR